MSEKHEEKGLRSHRENTSLSVGALKTGLRVAAKDTLSQEQSALARKERPYLRGLSDDSVRLALKEPPMWEYRLYFQALQDFVQAEAAEAGTANAHTATTETFDVIDWMLETFDEYQRLGTRFDRLINTELQTALGAPGEPGDAAAIVAVAKKAAKIYRRFIDIRNEALSRRTDPLLEETAREFGRMCDESIQEFETYPSRSLDTLMNALADADGETEVVLHFAMKLKADTDPFTRALRRAQQRL